MVRLLLVFILQLLSGTFRLCLLQRTDLRSVRPGENITLHCDITVNYEISWFHQSSEEMKLLVSAGTEKLNKLFILNYNVDENHYDGTGNTSSVDLVITGVTETDLGLYYCGGRNGSKPIQFGKAIKINFADDGNRELGVPGNVTEHSRLSAGCGLLWTVIMCVCMFCILLSIICVWVFCCRMPGYLASSCGCCCNKKDLTEEEDLQYASLGHEKEPRASTARTTASDLDSVTYTRVASQPSNHLLA